MEKRYKLVVNSPEGNQIVEIEEPAGYDGFTSKLYRDELHGISAEYSETELEFTCIAAEVIKNSYEMYGPDAEVVFIAESSCDGSTWEEEYRGLIDFMSYQYIKGKYNRVLCKTGDISTMVTFNKRFAQEVFVNSTEGLDGAALQPYENLEKVIEIPGKEIILNSRFQNQQDSTYDIGNDIDASATKIMFMSFFLNTTGDEIPTSYGSFADLVLRDNIKDLPPLLTVDNRLLDFDTLNIKLNIEQIVFNGHGLPNVNWACPTIFIIDVYGEIREIQGPEISLFTQSYYIWGGGEINDSINVSYGDKIYVGLVLNGEFTHPMTYDITQGVTDLTITTTSRYKESTAKTSLIHETLSRITEVISNNELTVKSDYYGRPDSEINPVELYGGGSLRCLTNGLSIRNATLTDGSEGFYSISMQKLYRGLNPIDCIGLGFSYEDGQLFVRVEPWSWFYKDEVILVIDDPAEVTREVNQEEIYSQLKIGFKKYTDINDANGLDAFMTERGYTTKIKATDEVLELLSEFVSDPYVIEYTRRMAIEKDSKDWKYDNDLFIISLRAVSENSSGNYYYLVDRILLDSGNTVISPETLMNIRISPARNAIRWSDKILNFTGSDKLYLTSATGNANAKGEAYNVITEVGEDEITYSYVYGDDPGGIINESQDISRRSGPLLKPELLRLEYPISPEQYKTIKDNPYGKIIVDGEECYLNELEYNRRDGMTNFVLVPKY